MTENLKTRLLVFALKEEDTLSDIPGFIKIFTGVGKLNAALALEHAINLYHPVLVVNLGTAGGITRVKDECVQCSQFVQIDMNCEPLGIKKYVTPGEEIESIFNEQYVMSDEQSYTIGTSDSFITTKEPYKQDGIDLVDMEAYALAKVCEKHTVKFKCFKYITDECDTSSPSDWKENLQKAKPHFEEIMKRFIE